MQLRVEVVSINKWTKPMVGRLKYNMDASLSSRKNHVGVGVCLQDDQECFVLAKIEWSEIPNLGDWGRNVWSFKC
jgi:hypothetical protein